MEERRQPAEETVRPSRERMMRKVQQSPVLMHALKQAGLRRLPARIASNEATSTTHHTVPIPHFDSIGPVARCEACLSFSPERLEMKMGYGHLRRKEALGILHHNFDGLRKSAAKGCDLCRILFWAVQYKIHSQMKAAAPNVESICTSDEKFYLRLTKVQVGYITKASLLLCTPIPRLTTESQKDPELKKWTAVARADAFNEPVATETSQISDHPDSKEVYNLIANWMENCRTNHASCKAVSQQIKSNVFPKRLIDVGTTDGVEIPRLIDVQEAGLVYAALSYAWGPSGNHALLTKANAVDLSRAIEVSSLPKTFQDAMVVCQKLSVKYLWIDALCILQSRPGDDSPNEELSQQIAIMGQIYANAVFTIAAASASSVHQGLFRSEKRFPTSLQPHRLYDHPTEKQWYITPPEPDWRTLITNGPLQQRGWAMQERTLSRRILHYTYSTVFWECTELKASEFRPLDIMSGYPLHDPQFAAPLSGCYKGLPVASRTPLSLEEKAELLTKVWASAVSDYTGRQLTSHTDMLPAISAIAQAFQQLTGDIYLAGLWQSVLWLNLLWYTTSVSTDLPRRPTRYNAPSWSWASVIGTVVMKVHGRPDLPSLAILSVSTTPLSMSNPDSQVRHGTLHVRGALRKDFRATRRRTNALVEHYIRRLPVSSPAEMLVNGIPVRFDIPDLNRPESRVHFDIRSDDELGFCVLQLCGLMQSGFKREGHPFFYAMAIVPTDVNGEYRRIGLVEVCDEGFFNEPEAAITTLTLV